MKSVRLGQTLGRSLFQQRCYSTVHDVPQNASALSQSPLPTPPQRTSSLLDQAASATGPRSNWTKDEITEIHQTPLMELAFAAVCDRSDPIHNPQGYALVPTLTQHNAGHTSSPLSQTIGSPTMYLNEHQNRRLLRRLLILCPVVPVQYWPQRYKTIQRRIRPRGGSHRQGEWKQPVLYGCCMAGYAGPETGSKEHCGDGQGCPIIGNGSMCHAGHAR